MWYLLRRANGYQYIGNTPTHWFNTYEGNPPENVVPSTYVERIPSLFGPPVRSYTVPFTPKVNTQTHFVFLKCAAVCRRAMCEIHMYGQRTFGACSSYVAIVGLVLVYRRGL